MYFKSFNFNLAGEERYRAITSNHIRNADGAFLVYDISNKNSFESIEKWYNIIKKTNGDNVVIFLVGNKGDLIEKSQNNRKVTKEEAIEYAKNNHFQGFCECSAMKNVNIKEVFKTFSNALYKKNKKILKEKTNEKIFYLKKMQNERHDNNCYFFKY